MSESVQGVFVLAPFRGAPYGRSLSSLVLALLGAGDSLGQRGAGVQRVEVRLEAVASVPGAPAAVVLDDLAAEPFQAFIVRPGHVAEAHGNALVRLVLQDDRPIEHAQADDPPHEAAEPLPGQPIHPVLVHQVVGGHVDHLANGEAGVQAVRAVKLFQHQVLARLAGALDNRHGDHDSRLVLLNGQFDVAKHRSLHQ